jgi:anti-sigma B factor antagonist
VTPNWIEPRLARPAPSLSLSLSLDQRRNGFGQRRRCRTCDRRVLAEDPPSLIIDLLGVQFLASAGVAILLNAREKFVDCERFSVVAQGRMTSRAIQLLDPDRLLSLQETVEEALSKAKARQVPVASPAPIPREPTA